MNQIIDAERDQFNLELRAQNYDVIRFSTYRTACKLRFVQKKLNFHLINLWNVIEALREHGLDITDVQELSLSRLRGVLETIYTQLNQRLPSDRKISIEHALNTAVYWFFTTSASKISRAVVYTLSLKYSLVLLSSGKVADKFSYIFSQISDSSGILIPSKFSEFVKCALVIPAILGEAPSFPFQENIYEVIFSGCSCVTLSKFEEIVLLDPAPPCFLWFTTFHRLVSVENVIHRIQCSACERQAFTGFRYRCQRCVDYNMCQDCFWRGRTSQNHKLDHEIKEYTYFKCPSRLIGSSLKKSLRCMPKDSLCKKNATRTMISHRHLSSSAPTTPLSCDQQLLFTDSCACRMTDSPNCSINKPVNVNLPVDTHFIASFEDEHKVIAKLSARLAKLGKIDKRAVPDDKRLLISQLETQNRLIVREIQRLKSERNQLSPSPEISISSNHNPHEIINEIKSLKQRKNELEERMYTLQKSKEELVGQLETLMKLLKQKSKMDSPISCNKETNDDDFWLSVNYPTYGSVTADVIRSPMQSDLHAKDLSNKNASCLQALKSDLMVAADSLTNAMMSLVRELHSDPEVDADSAQRPGDRKSLEQWTCSDHPNFTIHDINKYLDDIRADEDDSILTTTTTEDEGDEQSVSSVAISDKERNRKRIFRN